MVAFLSKTTEALTHDIHSFKKDWYLMIVVLQAMWIFILVMPVLTEMAGTGNKYYYQIR